MTSWDHHIIGKKSCKSDYFSNKQLQSLRYFIKEQEEKKRENKRVERKVKIPGRLIGMSDYSFGPYDRPTFPVCKAEIYPTTYEEAATLLNEFKRSDGCAFTYEIWAKGPVGIALNKSNKLEPERIIHSGPATIVFWNDKTKTVVKCSENDIYDEYEAFCAALAIKMFGSNSHLKKMIRDRAEDRTPKKEEVDDLVTEIKVKCEDNSLQEALNRLKRAFMD